MKPCKTKRARTKLLLAFLPVLCLLLLFVPCIPAVALCDVQGHVLCAFPADSAESFSVSFRHSANKGMVIERYGFDARRGEVWLQTGLFENYGAGMLDTVPEGIEHSFEDGFVRLDFPRAAQAQISYIPGGEAKHLFTFGSHTVPLYELSYHRTVAIRPMRLSAAVWLWCNR